MKKTVLSIFMLTMIFLSGCGANSQPDTYIECSDYQYAQWSSGIFFPKVQQGDGVVYLFHQGFVYYLEEGADVILPLCNKADCLHDREPDPEKWEDCNAFMGTERDIQLGQWDNAGIAKSGDNIYWLNHTQSLQDPQVLRRCALDGTKKETVYTWDNEESAVLEWIIHRDVLYYVEKRYYLEDETVMVETSLKALPLTGLRHQPVTLYESDPGLNVLSLGDIQAYGNYIYFGTVASWRNQENTSGEDLYDRLYVKTFVYDIQKDSLDILTVPDLPKSAAISSVQFWQDQIILAPYDQAKEGDAPTPVYIAALDGSHPEVLLEDVPQSSYFLSDGEYLYLFDDWMPDIDDWLSNPGLYTVYDKEMRIVDTFTAPLMPNGRPERLPVGGGDWMYYIVEREEDGGWSVARWDKSGIGSYGGAAIELEYIHR